jgi:YD repeat-containing protein
MVQPDGRATVFEYDPLQRLTAVIDNDGNRMAFTLDSADDVVREDAQTANGTVLRSLSRVYDTLGRVQAVTDGELHSTTFGYDAVGNATSKRDPLLRLRCHEPSVNRAYDAAGNTIRIGGAAALAANRHALAVDAQARSWRTQMQARAQTARAAKRGGKASTAAPAKLAPATVREFAYDDAGRLKQVKRDGVVAMDYLYNTKGEHVYRSGSGQTVRTVYDEAGHWLGDYDATGNALQQAIWLDDLPVGLLVGAGTNQKLYYLEPDAARGVFSSRRTAPLTRLARQP